MMNNSIKILQEEHNILLQAIDVAKEVQKINDRNLYFKLMYDLIVFFREYTETYHYPKEEIILHPLLVNHPDKTIKPLLHILSDNHEDFKALIADIENYYVLLDYQPLHVTMNKYLIELMVHIERENNVMPLMTTCLSDKDLQMLLKKFRELDEKHGEKEELKLSLNKIKLQLASY